MKFFAFFCRSEGLCPGRPVCVCAQLAVVFSRRSRGEPFLEKFKINPGQKQGDGGAAGSRVPPLSLAAARQRPSEILKLSNQLFLTHFKSRHPNDEHRMFSRYLLVVGVLPDFSHGRGFPPFRRTPFVVEQLTFHKGFGLCNNYFSTFWML